MKDWIKWVCADAKDNHNKYYEMALNDDDSIDVKYGRVGGHETVRHYAPYETTWEALIKKREQHGYKINNRGVKSAITVNNGGGSQQKYKDIEDKQIKELIDQMIASSRQFMQANYTVVMDDITQKMVDEAQNHLNQLNNIKSNGGTVWQFNEALNALFVDIPRKMDVRLGVAYYTAKTDKDFDRILQRENDLFDTFYQNYVQIQKAKELAQKQAEQNKDNSAPQKTILEENGVFMDECTYAEEDYVLKKLSKRNWENISNADRMIRAFKVNNENTEKRFNDYCAKKGSLQNSNGHKGKRFYFHGTKFENLFSILCNGLLLNPNATTCGKAFGQGTYFAECSEKSMGYTSRQGSRWAGGNMSSGYLLMYEVAAGNSFKVDRRNQYTARVGWDFREKDLKNLGDYDSVYAVGETEDPNGIFRNSEIMVYNENASTIRYIMEVGTQSLGYKVPYAERAVMKFDRDNIKAERNGDEITFSLDKVDSTTRNVLDKYYGGIDSITINIKTDQIDTPRSVGTADANWLKRTLKKAYVDSDKEWKSLTESADMDKFLGIETETKQKKRTGRGKAE